MSTRIRSHHLVLLVLLVALSGTAWAAQKITSKEIAKNAIRAKHIQDSNVRGTDLANGAVTSPKVANGSLEARDFATGELPAGPEGPRGLPGAQGPRGEQGAPGAQGVAGTARAYATVIDHNASPCAPGCNIIRSKGVALVTRSGVGTYCVNAPGIDRADVSWAVSVDWDNTSNPEGNASAMPSDEFGTCPAEAELFGVRTEMQQATNVRNAADTDSTSVAGNAVPSDDVSFNIVIP